ncbi:hypothetical protein FN846DRAFT_904957 [Sphaerosporella brunnea]|uniref:NmrA-like domain-containing protein n=1 Tax=Sphaerosporella brunnea TaxID=1250544 RepID=A0A5J5F397_9PEZI|nr:hypothetical protein FN846DRAFT_904957 [Sphaerosporella brunnea]
MGVMVAHLATEQYIKASGLQYTLIREGVYTDVFPFFLNWFPHTKKIMLTNDGPIAWTSRDELGEQTAKLLADEGKVTKVMAQALGKNIEFEIVPFEEYAQALINGGKPEWLASVRGSTCDGVAKGEEETTEPLLEELLGRKPIGATEWLQKTLKNWISEWMLSRKSSDPNL